MSERETYTSALRRYEKQTRSIHHVRQTSRGGGNGSNKMDVDTMEHWGLHTIASNLVPVELQYHIKHGHYHPNFFNAEEQIAWELAGFKYKSAEKISDVIQGHWTRGNGEFDLAAGRELLFGSLSFQDAEQRFLAGEYTYNNSILSPAELDASKLIFGKANERIIGRHGQPAMNDSVHSRNLTVLRQNFTVQYKEKGFSVGLLDCWTLPMRAFV